MTTEECGRSQHHLITGHHVMCILLLTYGIKAMGDTLNASWARMGLVCFLHMICEQQTWIALIMYRLKIPGCVGQIKQEDIESLRRNEAEMTEDGSKIKLQRADRKEKNHDTDSTLEDKSASEGSRNTSTRTAQTRSGFKAGRSTQTRSMQHDKATTRFKGGNTKDTKLAARCWHW